MEKTWPGIRRAMLPRTAPSVLRSAVRGEIAAGGYRISGAGDRLGRVEVRMQRRLQVVRPLGHREAGIDQALVQRELHVAAQAGRDRARIVEWDALAVVERGQLAAEGTRFVL